MPQVISQITMSAHQKKENINRLMTKFIEHIR